MAETPDNGGHVVNGEGRTIIAGDGYAYHPYFTSEVGVGNRTPFHFWLLRANSSGATDNIHISDTEVIGPPLDFLEFQAELITNGDQGVLLTSDFNGVSMALVNGASVNVIGGPGIPGGGLVVPVLQAQDGSFVGTTGDATQNYMIAFDASGGLRWSVAGNYEPQIATADGGVIATDDNGAVFTFGGDGSATGQMATLLTQSWRGNVYQDGAVDKILEPLIQWALTKWAHRMANGSENATAARPWYFTLKWQNQYDFIPDVPTELRALKMDITNQSAIIKASGLQALKLAYSQWPVTVGENLSFSDHKALVETPLNGANCGLTNNNQTLLSSVYYECVMEQAQVALQIIINNAQDESIALGRQDLFQAIGRGVGNTAAHEIGHQILGGCCSMDVLTSADAQSAATYNNGDSDGDPRPQFTNSDPATYTGFGKDGKTPIHWEATTQQALNKCLALGYRDFGALNCSAVLHLSRNRSQTDERETVWAAATLIPQDETGRRGPSESMNRGFFQSYLEIAMGMAWR